MSFPEQVHLKKLEFLIFTANHLEGDWSTNEFYLHGKGICVSVHSKEQFKYDIWEIYLKFGLKPVHNFILIISMLYFLIGF